jgi:YD repeat-containing protein
LISNFGCYDAEDRLISVAYQGERQDAEADIIDFEYDGYGRRVRDDCRPGRTGCVLEGKVVFATGADGPSRSKKSPVRR